MILSTIVHQTLQGHVFPVQADFGRLHLGEDLLPMSVSQVLAAESLDELSVVGHGLDFIRECREDFVFLTLLQLKLHLHVLRLVAANLFDDRFSVLVFKVSIVPYSFQILE